jgi:hypothetical protein
VKRCGPVLARISYDLSTVALFDIQEIQSKSGCNWLPPPIVNADDILDCVLLHAVSDIMQKAPKRRATASQRAQISQRGTHGNKRGRPSKRTVDEQSTRSKLEERSFF